MLSLRLKGVVAISLASGELVKFGFRETPDFACRDCKLITDGLLRLS